MGSDADTTHANLFAERLNLLFETRTSPAGVPYTPKDVSAATRITRQYLSLARRGLIKKPSAWHVHKLAGFFAVDDSFFTREALGPEGEDRLDDRLLRALANPMIRHIALRASELSKPAQAVVFRMVEDVYALTTRADAGGVAAQQSDPALLLKVDDRREEADDRHGNTATSGRTKHESDEVGRPFPR